MSTFSSRLLNAISQKGTPCIVGIDPVLERIPEPFRAQFGDPDSAPTSQDSAKIIGAYSELVVEAVHDLVPAVKPQSAFFERYGSHGVAALEAVASKARSLGLEVILDAKRGDIDSTSQAYADGILGPNAPFGYDCVTLNPYLGMDSLEPFFQAAEANGRGVFVCVRTSNPGAIDFQSIQSDDRELSDIVAERLNGRQGETPEPYGWLGAVVGATYPEQARRLRRLLPRSLFLVPGMGAQGGDHKMLSNFFDSDGRGAVVSSSRAINYPSGTFDTVSQVRAAIIENAQTFVAQVRNALS